MNAQQLETSIQLQANGRVVIHDRDTGEVILDKQNAIHPQNMATAISRALARETSGSVFKLAFGNGGTFINGSMVVVYRSPNTIGSATLYNQTYEVQVDDLDPATPSTNSVVAVQSPAPALTSLTIVTALLSAGEPAGQALTDGVTTDPEALYMFDEVCLKTSDDLMLSHLIFSPIEKTANRAFLITYSLTISVA